MYSLDQQPGLVFLIGALEDTHQYRGVSKLDELFLWPFIIYFIAVLLLVAAMLGLSYFLGERHRERETGEPYESGILPTGSARLRLSAQFYLIAMFFVIFDLEVVFVVAWAVNVRELGWAGYLEILIFIVILLAALVYLWRLGALDWGPRTSRAGED